MSVNLQDRTIVITGGTGGLGTALVELFESAGAICHVTARKLEPDRPRVRFHAVDVTDQQVVVDFYQQFMDLWASIHLVGGFAIAPVEKTSTADFESMMRLNALSSFLCCREAIGAMRRAGAGDAGRAGGPGAGGAAGPGGRIVNVAARPAVVPTGGMVAYSASKAAVASITQSLAEEVKSDGILINAVLPSIMDTPANRRAMPNADYSNWPTVQNVAQTIAFLASPDNALTSGALVPVYGGA
jgi:NAD(P)-dependent dehydrogenase (short-subunit alcohol dehydrogenase family)